MEDYEAIKCIILAQSHNISSLKSKKLFFEATAGLLSKILCEVQCPCGNLSFEKPLENHSSLLILIYSFILFGTWK